MGRVWGANSDQYVATVEVEAARFFNRFSRKGSMLGRVAINPSTFKVDLRRDDADLPRERLSAGEKQLLAISLLRRRVGRPKRCDRYRSLVVRSR
jgi:DNA sulfur modification protein DndD